MARDLQSVASRLAALPTPSGGKKKKARKAAQPAAVPQAGNGPSTSKPRQRRRRNQASETGDINIRRSEVVEVKLDATSAALAEKTGHINVHPDDFAWLKKLGALYERIRWNAVSVHWVPAVAMTVSGSVHIGVDWDVKGSDTSDVSKLYARTPHLEVAIHDGSKKRCVLPQSKLHGRLWYNIEADQWQDKCPAIIRYCVTTPVERGSKLVAGYFVVDYSVQLAGAKMDD